MRFEEPKVQRLAVAFVQTEQRPAAINTLKAPRYRGIEEQFTDAAFSTTVDYGRDRDRPGT